MTKRKFFGSLLLAPFAAAATVNAKAATARPVVVPVEFNFEPVAPAAVRDVIMPEITKILEEGVRGYREKWQEALKAPPKPTLD